MEAMHPRITLGEVLKYALAYVFWALGGVIGIGGDLASMYANIQTGGAYGAMTEFYGGLG